MIDNARIAKNTVYLYIRMIFVLGANFFAVRVLLEALGVDDYGLFNLIVGFVTLFTLLNGALQSTVQRFLCFELGKDKGGDTKAVFAVCLLLFAALAGVILLASETIGLWFVNHKLNIPASRSHSAAVVYQLSILVMLAKTMQIPYTALIVSYERMNVFAKISIVEAVLTLGAALALKFIVGDRLIWYTSLYTLATLIVVAVYAGFCRVNFPEARFPRQIERGRIKAIGAFFSWSIFGAVANMLKQQGLNVLLNLFFGVAFNATWALSNKVGMAVNQLVSNFQQAFQPQIIKLWAKKDKTPYYDLLSSASKFSFYLLFVCSLPLICFTEFFLSTWLKGVLPPQVALFVRLTIVFSLVEALAAPFWTGIQATGKIAIYQISVSGLIASVFFGGWLMFAFEFSAWWVMALNICVSISCHVYRIVHLKIVTGFPLERYLMRSMFPVALVSFACAVMAIKAPLLACFACPIVVFVIGVSKQERCIVISAIRKWLAKVKEV